MGMQNAKFTCWIRFSSCCRSDVCYGTMLKHIQVTDNRIVGCFCTDMGGKGREMFTVLCRLSRD